ncbi:MAG: hypothetical protein AB1797_14065, partial [bacterium]
RDRVRVKLAGNIITLAKNLILRNIEGVLATIREGCLFHPPLTPPIKGGEALMPTLSGQKEMKLNP